MCQIFYCLSSLSGMDNFFNKLGYYPSNSLYWFLSFPLPWRWWKRFFMPICIYWLVFLSEESLHAIKSNIYIGNGLTCHIYATMVYGHRENYGLFSPSFLAVWNKGITLEECPLKQRTCLDQKILFFVFHLLTDFLWMQICQISIIPFHPTSHPTGSLSCPLQYCAYSVISFAFSVMLHITSSSQIWIY